MCSSRGGRGNGMAWRDGIRFGIDLLCVEAHDDEGVGVHWGLRDESVGCGKTEEAGDEGGYAEQEDWTKGNEWMLK